jgi:16S rRNA (guanine527-N7)-methyltransferase
VADRLGPVLERGQRLGFLGPAPIGEHVEHSRRLVRLLGAPPASFLDLGSGAGVPGLILAEAWPEASGVFLDAAHRRGEHLQAASAELGLADRVTVVVARAEDAARDPHWRERFELVVARSFAAPAVTAECAVGFLAPNGRLLVTEPPGGGAAGRWDDAGLARLGLSPPTLLIDGSTSVAVFRRVGPLDDRWPRRTGVPERRPLWGG